MPEKSEMYVIKKALELKNTNFGTHITLIKVGPNDNKEIYESLIA